MIILFATQKLKKLEKAILNLKPTANRRFPTGACAYLTPRKLLT